MKFNSEKFSSLTPNDRREILKMRKFLKLLPTKRGRKTLRTQKYWRDYQGI